MQNHHQFNRLYLPHADSVVMTTGCMAHPTVDVHFDDVLLDKLTFSWAPNDLNTKARRLSALFEI